MTLYYSLVESTYSFSIIKYIFVDRSMFTEWTITNYWKTTAIRSTELYIVVWEKWLLYIQCSN
jgi:hypothetical protein